MSTSDRTVTASKQASLRSASSVILYGGALDRLLILLAVVPFLIAVVGALTDAIDPMFFMGLIAATVASLLVRALRTETSRALRQATLVNLVYERGGRAPAATAQIEEFLGSVQHWLNVSRLNWAGAVVIGGLFAIFAVPQFFVVMRVDWSGLVRARGAGVFAVLADTWGLATIALLLVIAGIGFGLGIFAWRMVCLGGAIFALGRSFDARIRTQHPDGAGGWAPIGAVCFANALILIVPAIHVGLWRALMAFVPGVRRAYGDYADWFSGLLLVLFVLALLAFVVPLYGVHRAMVRERAQLQRQLDAIRARTDDLAARMREAAAGGKAATLDELTKEYSQLRAVYESERAIPTWPVDLRILGKYVAAQLVPFISVGKVAADFLTDRLIPSS
jgi:hypothetical protein